jgi:hypothetical protein
LLPTSGGSRRLDRDINRLTDQIAFVGEQYGGAQERFGSIRGEAELIAANLHCVLDQWLKAVMEAKPLIEGVSSHFRFSFFPVRGYKTVARVGLEDAAFRPA